MEKSLNDYIDELVKEKKLEKLQRDNQGMAVQMYESDNEIEKLKDKISNLQKVLENIVITSKCEYTREFAYKELQKSKGEN
ncbi:hypothetical protein ACDN41_12095 [Priestia aryabhattai]|uniref:hypothetical protein n=1 Tax=Priestia aryabhattai TaxID=412384 RepID=UPI0035321B72